MKFSFKNDYSEGVHPDILNAILETNYTQQVGYGEDDYCNEAKKLIITAIKNPNARIFFVAGGTLANLLVIGAALKPYESVISAETGHINTNETGAIEFTGHKVNSIATLDGKLTPIHIQSVLDQHTNFPHQVKPRIVYISNATELGTIYTKSELQKLSTFCKEKKLLLFMDGARLGNALTSLENDLSLEEIAALVDVFYIGGTKNGAMFGEAIVVTNPFILEDLDFHMKQKGGLMAKGRFLGVQFSTLFKDNLYLDLAGHANQQAMKIKNKLQELGFDFLSETSTNQIFPILKNHQIEILLKDFEFYVWKKIDGEHSAIRLITSWATPDDAVERFIAHLEKL